LEVGFAVFGFFVVAGLELAENGGFEWGGFFGLFFELIHRERGHGGSFHHGGTEDTEFFDIFLF